MEIAETRIQGQVDLNNISDISSRKLARSLEGDAQEGLRLCGIHPQRVHLDNGRLAIAPTPGAMIATLSRSSPHPTTATAVATRPGRSQNYRIL